MREILLEQLGEILLGGGLPIILCVVLPANHCKFAVIQPNATTVRAGIDLNAALLAEEVSEQNDVGAFRTVPATIHVHVNLRVESNVEQGFALQFRRLVHLLQFEVVEPNPAASAFADINGQLTNLQRFQGLVAGRAVHILGDSVL